jgi:hypothetical protein
MKALFRLYFKVSERILFKTQLRSVRARDYLGSIQAPFKVSERVLQPHGYTLAALTSRMVKSNG